MWRRINSAEISFAPNTLRRWYIAITSDTVLLLFFESEHDLNDLLLERSNGRCMSIMPDETIEKMGLKE